MLTLVQYLLSLLSPGLQGGDTRVHGLGSFEGRFIVMCWNTRGPTYDFMGLPTRPGGNWAPATQPWGSCRLLSWSMLASVITVSILTVSHLFLEVIFFSFFLSLSFLLYFGICLTLWKHSKHLNVDSASTVHKQAEESCLLASPVGSGHGTQEFVLGLRTPKT